MHEYSRWRGDRPPFSRQTRRRAFLFHRLAAFVVKAAEQVALPRAECTDVGRADNPQAAFSQYARKLAHAAVRVFQVLDSVRAYGVVNPFIGERQRLIQVGFDKRRVPGSELLGIAIDRGDGMAPVRQRLADRSVTGRRVQNASRRNTLE